MCHLRQILQTRTASTPATEVKECSEGTVLEFIYTPGQGTLLRQNGAEMGPVIEGKPFQEVLWDIYFGKDTCCDDLLGNRGDSPPIID